MRFPRIDVSECFIYSSSQTTKARPMALLLGQYWSTTLSSASHKLVGLRSQWLCNSSILSYASSPKGLGGRLKSCQVAADMRVASLGRTQAARLLILVEAAQLTYGVQARGSVSYAVYGHKWWSEVTRAEQRSNHRMTLTSTATAHMSVVILDGSIHQAVLMHMSRSSSCGLDRSDHRVAVVRAWRPVHVAVLRSP